MARPQAPAATAADLASWILCAAATIFGAWALQVGWSHGILDVHGWRQSHTALSVQEMLRGGPFWHYRTPIFGPPWQWPLELPIFQWIVSVVVRLAGTPLEQTGRAVSVAFFVGTLAVSWIGLEIFDVSPRHRPVILALLWASPLYIFWSRSFMIESTALFFAVAYIVAVHRATRPAAGRIGVRALAAGTVAGALAGAAKVTTFAPFLAAAALMAAAGWRHGRRSRGSAILVIALAFVVPILATLGWLAFVDLQKGTNQLASELSWSGERALIFGSLQDRLVLRNWYAAPANHILGGTRHAVVASAWVFAGACVALAVGRRRLGLCAACALLYLLPIALFMRLHVVHVYYGYENGLFLTVILGCGIVACLEGPVLARWAGVVLFAAALTAMAANYLRGYYVDQAAGDLAPMTLGVLTGRLTAPDDVLLIYGLDSAPDLPYSAGRRAIMDTKNRSVDDPAVRIPLARLAAEGLRIGVVVVCGAARGDDTVRANIVKLGFPGRPWYAEPYCDLFARP